MTRPRLILHVGHPKTGSSALQSAFALSIDALARAGLHYPRPAKFAEAVRGGITSGNFNPARVADAYDAAVAAAPGCAAVLLSNEACFRIYQTDTQQLGRLRDRGVEVEVILFVRDPFEVELSSHMQGLKRGGVSRRFRLQAGGGRFLDLTGAFLDTCARLGLRLKVRNYSRLRDRLLPETEALLEVPPGTLTPPPVGQVNRSLTRAEMALMSALNAALPGQVSAAIADALCTDLPDIPSEAPAVSEAEYQRYLEMIAPRVEALNARLPPEAAYRLRPYAELADRLRPETAEDLRLSDRQLAVLTRALAATTGLGAGPSDRAPDPTGGANGLMRRLRSLALPRR
ncbi:hypothetical protein [Roseicyclus persicicus]|uniref:Uncharacterized protein n=1 Tax=Roseicyclus persicicus TaxID=2650661 RepID=A0A7X6JYF4_9RHOB|nr:hypothetical protein [Roseibacterium persicicum]NKX44035.1 hypothetical protein [Roseibacterium persicicum]